MNNFLKERRKSNLEILRGLRKMVKRYPDLRFGQIMESFIPDLNFNEESTVSLEKLKNSIKHVPRKRTRLWKFIHNEGRN